MIFTVIPRSDTFPKSGQNAVFLRIDHWNDYSFITMFDVLLFDEQGTSFELGNVKIGFVGQTTSISTYSTLDRTFDELPDTYFSVGQDESYYRVLGQSVSPGLRDAVLDGLRDVVIAQSNFGRASGEEVFRVSLLRSISTPTIEGQFRRVLNGGAPLDDFDFGFNRPQSEEVAGIDLVFKVIAGSKPSTNVHALIGRNGVGKTTLLNEMTASIMTPASTAARFYGVSMFGRTEIQRSYFSSLISVAFSAFDPFTPPQEQSDPERGTCYYYVGLKDIEDASGTLFKSLTTMRQECVTSLTECFSDRGKRARWTEAIATLESDENFARMNLKALVELSGEALKERAGLLVKNMSSGHAIVLMTISRLVAKVEEKSLILLDEPESHLHPPLLAAFTRALSQLLHNRNGVAIIATHSPVVLQEVPRSCAWVITRSQLSMRADPPTVETFGENVGVLTREVFGLEVVKSGFHRLLTEDVAQGETYDAIVAEYNDQLGMEARGILRAMIADRDGRVRQA
ncbi:AAA family ATPase [Mesorhizobium sp. B2-6-1]|uniref:AAA family ATPase n=1 Tax=Mesorhizobium sp. B2-6-1 TaxID=2589916 RepID=UPI001127D230|nr:AAA family ATPase [Mesorhizobium sp. B2-6-1]TPJ64469.1 ATP-binding cassette domain-containing protein [Mesorhizobium sp. B2-6-1]